MLPFSFSKEVNTITFTATSKEFIMLTCMICGYTHEFMISPTHIKKHGLTTKEYKEKFPTATLRIFSEQTKSKMSKAKIGKPTWNKGVPVTEEQKKKLSETAKQSYASGERKHWNLGKTHSAETKQKISEANKNSSLTPEQYERLKAAQLKYRESERYVPPMLGKKLSEEAKLAIKQKLIGENNHQFRKTAARIEQIAEKENCSVLRHEDQYVVLECLTCNSIFKFTKQMFNESSDRKEKYCPTCFPRESGTSLAEKEVANFIKQIYSGQIVENDRQQLGGKEIDIYIPDLNLGFEFTGLYWHSEKQNPNRQHLLWKTQFAAKQGITLITIFEDEWQSKQEIVKSRVSGLLGVHTVKYHARDLEIKLITPKSCNSFLEENHIQGPDSSTIRLGLFASEKLVSVATFKKTNMVKGGDGKKWELSRFCSMLNTRVVGGAGKLLSHFQKNYNTENLPLISYADRRWSSGKLYEKLGFKFEGSTSPSYWYTADYKHRKHRSALMKHRLVKSPEDNKLTEWQLAQAQGFDRIWDCGTTKWILS